MKKLLVFLLSAGISLPAFCGFVEGEEAFNKQRYSQAFSEFLPLADEGDFRSQYYVGYLYINGYGITQDKDKGLAYLQKAIDQDYDMAQALMGYLYSEGITVPKDKKKALKFYQKASEQNNISANLNLGIMYYMGDDVTQDHQKALFYLERVPIEQKPIVSRYLGSIYLNNATLKNYQKALYYYTISAQQKDLSAFFALGEMYFKGLGVAADLTTALDYYKYAAASNYPPAQYKLGVIYANGEKVKKDTYKAYAWLKMASDQNVAPATDALNKLTKNMSLSELEKARKEIVLIQQNEMGKIKSPIDPTEQFSLQQAEQDLAISGTTQKQSIIPATARSRRITRRRRR